MDDNPYAPPATDMDSPVAPIVGASAGAGDQTHLSPELEMKAMEMLGQRRSRAGVRSFGVAWGICIVALIFVTGLVPALIVGSIIAGAISKVYVKSHKQAMVDAVAAELGIRPGLFAPDRYLLD